MDEAKQSPIMEEVTNIAELIDQQISLFEKNTRRSKSFFGGQQPPAKLYFGRDSNLTIT